MGKFRCLHMEKKKKTTQNPPPRHFWSPLMSMFVSLIGCKVPASPVGCWGKWQSLSWAFAVMITWSSFVPSVLLYYLTPALDLQSLQWLNKLQVLMQDFCLQPPVVVQRITTTCEAKCKAQTTFSLCSFKWLCWESWKQNIFNRIHVISLPCLVRGSQLEANCFLLKT